MTRRGRERPGLGGLWLLLVPAACCGGPLLAAGLAAAGLAAAGALAWGGLGLALAVLLAGLRGGQRQQEAPEVRARQSRDSGTMTSP